MYLIVGLGNPGPEYKNTRHNAGFIIMDILAKIFNIDFIIDKDTKIGKGLIFETQVILLKPLTYMNLSGAPVVRICNFYKILPQNIIVLHDEIDIPNSEIRYKFGGSTAGHNGLKNISLKTGTNDYHRIRLGVGRPANPNLSVSDWVLGSFKESELSDLISKYSYIYNILEKILKN